MSVEWYEETFPEAIRRGGIAIYMLIDPNTEEIRYVGKSKKPEERLRAHLRCRDGRTNPWKARWIANLIRSGQEPRMTVFHVARPETAARDERDAIAIMRKDHHLLNLDLRGVVMP